ncbi:putative 2OG-Fe(II) oxygenase [Pseudomarimonas salicorniae]|uniref:2OG-Fe(II) oxygenase family protein n=1 Tax=Pseudomarimonas salicorniae TaxID=2933270 RepID=A0ABT0GC64_9GAMM|nr:putative 2OG-Fe(II) oxygenase [Lysobacter sp. CAU 1642]MCK7592132.1 2OG-Fe(II) oxygenase family protein [Lysobacter sp. CAU 1642]
MFQVTNAFSVPMIVTRMPDCGHLNRELRELFIAKSREGKRYSNPEPFVMRNEALFESNFRLFDWPQPCVQKLRDFCLAAVYRTVKELNGYDDATLQRLHSANEAWFHVTRRGGYFGAHNHPMHSWSGVYCVCHEGDDPDTDSGKLAMLNPFAMNTMYLDYGNAHMRDHYGMGPRLIRFNPGELLIFPSWLLHEVLPYDGDDMRITVAFNVRFKYEGAQPANVPLG